jgi:hypothetical protein
VPGIPSERQFVEWAPDSPEGRTLSTPELQTRYRTSVDALTRFAQTSGVALADAIRRQWDGSAVETLREDIYGNFLLLYGLYQRSASESQGFLERIAAAVFDQAPDAAGLLAKVLRSVVIQ